MANIVNKKLLPPLVVEYINELLVIKASSKLTVDEYLSDLRLFFRYLISQKNGMDSPSELPDDYDMSYIDTDFIAGVTLKDINNFLTSKTASGNSGDGSVHSLFSSRSVCLKP